MTIEAGKVRSERPSSENEGSEAPPRRVAYTSITTNYLPKARVLAHSIKRFSPDVWFTLVILDRFDEKVFQADDPFDEVLSVDDFDLDESWIFGHTVVEACTAIKGHALKRLLQHDGERQVLYFDPDMVVLHSLDVLYQEFDHSSTLLTPHTTVPETELSAIADNEISPLKHGVYNLGFVGVKNCEDGMEFAGWWAERLDKFCFDDPDSGIFTDQRWVDLAPCLFDKVKVLREPSYNVATWNLNHRLVTGSVDLGLMVNDIPLVFYHFSGFDSGAQEIMLERYGKRSPALHELRHWYIEECDRMGQGELGSLPWHYGSFDNGQVVTKEHRFLYRKRQDLIKAFPHPFQTRSNDHSYYHWFEANGRTAVSDFRAAVAPVKSIDYEIVVLALEPNASNARRLEVLESATSADVQFRLVARPQVLSELFPVPDYVRVEEISDESSSMSCRDTLILQLLEKAESDLLIVELGVQVPELWDLRLQEAAASNSAIVTVSPLSNVGVYNLHASNMIVSERDSAGEVESTLAREAEDQESVAKLTSKRNLSSVEIDKVVSNMELRETLDVPVFFPNCFYFRKNSDAAALIATDGSSRSLADFARRCTTQGLDHVLAQNIFVAVPSEEIRAVHTAPILDSDLRSFNDRNVLFELRNRFAEAAAQIEKLPSVRVRYARRNLHVLHGWGGGLERWVRSYSRADHQHVNFVLQPVGHLGALGTEILLYEDIDAENPISRIHLPRTIENVATHNLAYERMLRRLLDAHGIDQIIVSSLIGHSLDVLRTGYPTTFICHDYFPMAPNLNLRTEVLRGNRLAAFSFEEEFANNAELFPNYTLEEARAVDSQFRSCITSGAVQLVAPSPSTRQLYLDLEPRLHAKDVAVIPHGTPAEFIDTPPGRFKIDSEKLRILLLGNQFAPQKGEKLITEIIGTLSKFADVYLIGCGRRGARWRGTTNVTVLESYTHNELMRLLRHIDPHIGLLLSDCAETFSYTLDELMASGIPAITTKIGAFADRIVDRVNGFFVEPNGKAVLDLIQSLEADRSALLEVRENLCSVSHRSDQEMVADYERQFGLPSVSTRAGGAPRLSEDTYARLCFEGTEAGQRPASTTHENGENAVLPINGESAVRQMSAAVGFWSDHWCAPHLAVRLFAVQPVRRGQLSIWFPPGHGGEPASVAIRVNGRDVCSRDVLRDAPSELDFEVSVTQGSPFLFEIDADESAIDSENDVRQLAAVVREVSFS